MGGELINFNYSSVSDNEYHNPILPQYIKVYGQDNFVPVKTIGKFCFANCIDLYSIIFPTTLENINSYSFAWDNSLSTIKLPYTIQKIDEFAFDNCTALEFVYVDSNKILNSLENGNDLFGSQVSTIYVKENIYDDSINKFKINNGKSYFFNSIENGYAKYVVSDNDEEDPSASEP